MFSEPTVFVVGAGASAEYGIAVGDKLKLEIAHLLNLYYDGGQLTRGDHQIDEWLRRHNQATTGSYQISQAQFRSARLISDAMPHALSIDNFIDAHRGDEEIALCAKLGITKAILLEEGRSTLAALKNPYDAFSFTHVANTWLARLFQMATENVAKSEVEELFDNLTLIVFNYDRCVEAYFPRALQQYYGMQPREAAQLLSKLRIIHPYGVAGGLDDRGEMTVPFGSTDVDLLEVSQGIRTFSEGLADSRIGSHIEAALRSASTLVFLGFSFHPLNLELLNSSTPHLKRILATTHGLSKSAVATIEKTLLETYNKAEPRGLIMSQGDRLDELELVDLKAYDFCSQYFRSLSSTRPLEATRSA